MKFIGGEMSNTRVILDDNLYDGVKFTNCTMVYSGSGGDMGIQNCTLNNCRWEFTGAAGQTISFLRGLASGMGPSGKELVRNLMNDILKD